MGPDGRCLRENAAGPCLDQTATTRGKTMHRMKIGLIAAALLLAFTAFFYSSVTSTLGGALARQSEDAAYPAQLVHKNVCRLNGLELTNLASERARRPGVL